MNEDDTARRASSRLANGRVRGYWWPVIALGAVLLLYSGFSGIMWWFHEDAYRFARLVKQEFAGDEVEALVALVQSDRHTFAERNRAVHALGAIGDERALGVLESFYTGRDCDHSRFLCQHELRKAIARCSGKNWAPGWLPFLPRRPQPQAAGWRQP